MYKIDKEVKNNPHRRWALPDRIFFACGACHILAYAFLEAYPTAGFKPVWIKPSDGYTGNHIIVVRDGTVFDYHGYSGLDGFLEHTRRKADRWWPGWRAELIDLPRHVLVSEPELRKYDGLWLREPKRFLHDALPRARQYLERFPPPE